jgi:magnesium chelatase subunit D
MDESMEGDEAPPAALLERLAYAVRLEGVTARDTREAAELLIGLDLEVKEARARLPQVELPNHLLQTLCAAASALGVGSLRADLFAARTARAHAALAGRTEVDADDVAAAVRLVLGPRATRMPEFNEADEETEPAPPEPPNPDVPEPPPPPPPEDSAEPEAAEPTGPLDDMLLQAALATLPHDLLARLQAGKGPRSASRSSGKSGAAGASGARGRPVGVRRGDPRTGQRLNLVETLRAAAPWQGLRRQADSARRVHVRSDDLRVTVRRPRLETTTLFVVDASGSSALNRLAEAKGAVELLLADCYVRRDSVALMAFRGRTAQLLLPATRSLVRAKRSLAALPGGGGTPLATALHACAEFVLSVQRRGQTPLVVLLTDGRANVALDGTGGRPRAEAEALVAAQQLRLTGCATLLVDSSPQAHPLAARLAHEMRATYLPLPHAGAQALSGVVRSRMAPAQR